MDMNYLVQRRINARKAYRRKVIVTIALSAILLVLILVGLIKVILDEKKAEDANKGNNVSENITPGLSGDNTGNSGENTPGTSGGENQGTTAVETPEPTPTETQIPTPVPKKMVAIDPGHGGEDLGSTRLGLYEKDANLAIAIFLKKELEDADLALQDHGPAAHLFDAVVKRMWRWKTRIDRFWLRKMVQMFMSAFI